jgi:hypothetical protein
MRSGHTIVHIMADSLLLVEQMRGRFKVKHLRLQSFHARATLLAHEIGPVTFEPVPREKNKDTDRLWNLGMDESETQLARGPATLAGQGESRRSTPRDGSSDATRCGVSSKDGASFNTRGAVP